jgi:diacylglycerol kinase
VEDQNTNNNKARRGTGFLNVLKSTLFAACGIQSRTNRERDFEHGKPSTFILAGIIFMVIFILGIVGVVQLVMSFATH